MKNVYFTHVISLGDQMRHARFFCTRKNVFSFLSFLPKKKKYSREKLDTHFSGSIIYLHENSFFALLFILLHKKKNDSKNNVY